MVPLLLLSLLSGDLRADVIEHGQTAALAGELDPAALYACTAQDLRLIRNAIFARHGYRFASRDLQAHFARFDWYAPDAAATDRIKQGQILTDQERKNVAVIKELEREQHQRDASALLGQCYVCQGQSAASRTCFCRLGRATQRTLGIGEDAVQWVGRWRIEDAKAVIRFTRSEGQRDGKPVAKRIDETKTIDWSVSQQGELACGLEAPQAGTSPCETP